MENNIAPPKEFVRNVQIVRFSSICFNMAITSLLLTLLAAFSTFIIPLFYAMVILVVILLFLLSILLVIFTFGLILLAENNIIKILYNFIQHMNTEKVMNISNKCFSLIPYFCIAGLVLCVVSLLTIIFSKPKGKVGKIIGLTISIIVMTLILIFFYAMGGVLWQS